MCDKSNRTASCSTEILLTELLCVPQAVAVSSFHGAAVGGTVEDGGGVVAAFKRALPALQKTESVPDVVLHSEVLISMGCLKCMPSLQQSPGQLSILSSEASWRQHLLDGRWALLFEPAASNSVAVNRMYSAFDAYVTVALGAFRRCSGRPG